MFKALTIKTIEIFGQVIESDTTILIKTLEDNTVVAHHAGISFDIDPDEYVKIIGTTSNFTH